MLASQKHGGRSADTCLGRHLVGRGIRRRLGSLSEFLAFGALQQGTAGGGEFGGLLGWMCPRATLVIH